MSVSSFVESIEYIEVSFGTSDTDLNVALSKGQNYEHCVPFMSSHSVSDYFDSKLFDMYFSGTTSDGIINFSRTTTRTSAATVKCYVVEFNPSEISVQQGSFSLTDGNTTDTVTIPTTLSGIDKTAVSFSWESDYTASTLGNLLVKSEFVSASGIEFFRGITTNSCSGHWFLFEDKGNNFTVDHRDSYYTSRKDVIAIDGNNCLDPLRSFILGSFTTDYSSTYISRTTGAVGMVTDGALQNYKEDPTYGNIYWNCQIITLTDTSKVYVPFNRSFFSMNVYTASPYEFTFGITCDTTTSMAVLGNMQGIEGSSGTTIGQKALLWSGEVTNSGTITLEFADTSSVIINASYMAVVDWAGITVSGTNDNIISNGTGEDQSFVKSVENFNLDFNTDSYNVALTKGQNYQNCAVFVSNRTDTAPTRLTDNVVKVSLYEPGVLQIRQAMDTSTTKKVDISVVEFWPDQVKVQYKNIYTAATQTVNIPITAVSSVDNCFILSSFFSDYYTNYTQDLFPRLNFATTSGVDVYINNNASSGYNVDVSFFVIEDLGNNFRVTHNTSSFVSAYYENYYDNTDSWTDHNTIPLINYSQNGAYTYPSRIYASVKFLYEYAPAQVFKYDATYGTIYWHGMIIKFIDDKIHVFNIPTTFNTSDTTKTGYYNSDFISHNNALSCFNNTQGSTFAVNYTGSVVDMSFITAKITDYDIGTYEISRRSSLTNETSGNISIVDWIGVPYSTTSGTNIKTNSMLASLQKENFTDTGDYIEVPITKGQNIYKCLPIVCDYASTSSNIYMNDVYKVVYRFPEKDEFFIRFIKGSSSSLYPVTSRELNISILEFNDDVEIQYGSTSSSSTSTTVDINEVNLDRAFLVFYASSDYLNVSDNKDMTICGRFVSSTQLSFVRSNNNGNMTITWYVVECSEESDYWTVSHIYNTSLGGSSSVNIDIGYTPDISKTIFFSSWVTSTSAANYPGRSSYKMRHSYDNTVNFEKYDASSYNMDYCNVEVVEFSQEVFDKGLRVFGASVTFSEINTTKDVVINTISGSSFDLNRSIVYNANSGNENESAYNSSQAWKNVCVAQKFLDGDTLRLTKGFTNGAVYCYPFVCEFPEYNKYYFEGYVKEASIPVDREVRAYRKSSGKMMDSTTSDSGTGYFLLETPYGDEHFIVAFDNEEGTVYNDLIYGQVIPTVISGCFAYNEGITTTSGFEIGVPLARQ